MNKFLFFTSGFILTYIFMNFLIPFLRKFITDKPNERSSHKQITPTAGGVSFILIAVFLNIFIKRFSIIALLPLAIIGLLDDKFKIPSLLRYLVQFSTVFFIFSNSELKLDISLNVNNSALLFLIYIVIIVAGTSLINFINFMDGIDCLIASTFFISLFFIGLFESNIAILILSGCLLGFIPWNITPAKVFMGDTGSTFLGAYYTMLCYSKDYSNALYLLLIIFPLIVDPFLTLILRISDNQNIFKAHKLHLYQRLNAGSFNHMQIVTIYLSTIIFNCIIYIYFNNLWLIISNSFWIMIGIYLNSKYAIPFKNNKFLY